MKKLKLKAGVDTSFINVTIKSNRLLLVPVSDVFSEHIFREFNAEITKYMTPKPPEDISDVSAFISISMNGMRQGNELVFAITDRITHDFIGICCCSAKDTPETPELGVWVKKSAHGKKLGIESITSLVYWAEKHLIYNYLIYPVDRANVASRAIPEALGGEIFEEKLLETQSGSHLDGVVYKIKKRVLAEVMPNKNFKSTAKPPL